MSVRRRTSTRKEKKADDLLPKWILIALSLIAAFLAEHLAMGWGRPVLLTVAIVAVGLNAKEYWSIPRYWVTIGAFSLVHSAVVVRFRDMMNSVEIPTFLAIAIMDGLIGAVIMTWAVVSSGHPSDDAATGRRALKS